MSPSLYLSLINLCWLFVLIPRIPLRRMLRAETGRGARSWDGSVLSSSKKEMATCQSLPRQAHAWDRRTATGLWPDSGP